MTKVKRDKLAKLLKEMKGEIKEKSGVRSTVVDCSDFLLAILGERV